MGVAIPIAGLGVLLTLVVWAGGWRLNLNDPSGNTVLGFIFGYGLVLAALVVGMLLWLSSRRSGLVTLLWTFALMLVGSLLPVFVVALVAAEASVGGAVMVTLVFGALLTFLPWVLASALLGGIFLIPSWMRRRADPNERPMAGPADGPE